MIGFDLLPRSEKKRFIGTKIKSVEKNYQGHIDYSYKHLISINFPNVIQPRFKCFICDQDYNDDYYNNHDPYNYVYTYHDHHDLLCMESLYRAMRSIINNCLKCTKLYTLPWSYGGNKSILPYKSLDVAMNHRELKPLTFYAGMLDQDSILNQINKDVILLIIYIYRDIRSL